MIDIMMNKMYISQIGKTFAIWDLKNKFSKIYLNKCKQKPEAHLNSLYAVHKAETLTTELNVRRYLTN